MAFVTKETKEKINTLVKEVRGYARSPNHAPNETVYVNSG